MTRKEAAIILEYYLDCWKRNEEGVPIDNDIEALQMAIEALKANVPNTNVGKWIPCSKRLPDEKDAGILKELGIKKRSEYVLATIEVKGERMTVTACTYDGKWDWKMKYAFPDFKVVAWMPLLEPYQEE